LWYAATFVLILLVLGTGIFVAIGVQVSRRLDISLAAATAAITHATSDWEAERAAGQTADAVEELRIPDRDLYLFDADGRPITPPQADAWITASALAASRTGRFNAARAVSGNREQQLQAERLGGIVGDLLTLARADAGERKVVRGALYLDDVASQAVAAARALAERKGVSLVVGLFEESRILGDADLVERLVLIVLDNAI